MRVAGALLLAFFLRGAAAAAMTSGGGMLVELIDVDAPASEMPAAARTADRTRGESVDLILPYRERGSWVRITPASIPPEPRLIVNGVAMGRLTLVLPDGKRIERVKTRPSSDPSASAVAAVFVLPERLAPGEALWLHSADRHRNLLELRLLSAADWRERERAAIAFALALYGALAAFVVIAATYWLILRERMFADHALYLLLLIVFMAMSSGLFYLPFHEETWTRLGVHAQWGFATAATGFAVGFANRFLDLARHVPRIARALEWLRIVFIALGVAIFVSPFPVLRFGATVALLVVSINLVMIGLGVYMAIRRNRYAAYFLAGWIPLTLGTNLRALQGTGFLEIPYEISFLYALGAAWEALVLTAGIADRALSFRRERDLARHLAEHDGLTGVLNRRASEARLQDALRHARAAAAPLAVLFLDIDHFKSINDRYGHAVGDAVLVAVAKRIAAQLRSEDTLGRWGGEEFVAIVADAPVQAARVTAERIRRAVEASPVHVGDDLVAVTVSIGLATPAAPGEEGAALVRRADEALYRAKGNGRNRVEEAPLPA